MVGVPCTFDLCFWIGTTLIQKCILYIVNWLHLVFSTVCFHRSLLDLELGVLMIGVIKSVTHCCYVLTILLVNYELGTGDNFFFFKGI